MLEVRAIEKSYEGKPLLRGVSFSLEIGETICLLGSSGSGKSTLLRIIAGLEESEGGDVLWDGSSIMSVPVHERNFGLMFQDYALFPHRSVAANVAFGLRMQALLPDEIDRRVQDALEQVNMAGFARRSVTDLSGGEQQRVALARAIAPRPRLLMLDEPLGALDRTLREQLTGELRQLLHQTGIPTIYVTHDQEEAFALADRLVLLSDGNVVQTGTPVEVYRQPKNAWVARFLGMSNLLSAEVISAQPLRVQTDLGVFEGVASSDQNAIPGAVVDLLLRPGAACVQTEQYEKNRLAGTVKDVLFAGESYRVTLDCGKGYIFNFTLENSPRLGEVIQLYIAPESVICLEAQRFMTDVIVLKKNIKGEETWRYEGKVLMSRPDAALIEASFNRADLPFHGITFREGDRFLEAYFTHQWFNIFEIHDCDDDHLKGWYCNVTFPSEIKEHEIGWRDLALDLLVYPDGKQLVLDEDEFAALAIDESTRQTARMALEKLKKIFQPIEEFDLVDVWRRLNGAQAA